MIIIIVSVIIIIITSIISISIAYNYTCNHDNHHDYYDSDPDQALFLARLIRSPARSVKEALMCVRV